MSVNETERRLITVKNGDLLDFTSSNCFVFRKSRALKAFCL